MGLSLFDITELRAEDAVLDLLMDPKPLNSGTSPAPGVAGFSGSIADLVVVMSAVEAGGVMATEGESARLALVLERGRVRRAGVDCLSGEMDRARSGEDSRQSWECPCAGMF